MTGSGADLNELNAKARRALLDALDALEGQRDALILVGAQAIYLHTGDADLAIAASTFDADLAIDPALLKSVPALVSAMHTAGFIPRDQPGIWESKRDGVEVDLLVPASVAGAGSRSADLGDIHGKRTARKARGLEAALVDHSRMPIAALEVNDSRRIEIMVAGRAALLVAKLHKIAERLDNPKRQKPKDALDIYRLLKSSVPGALAASIAMLLSDERAKAATSSGVRFLLELFGTSDAPGSQQAGKAVIPLDDPDTVAQSVAALAQELLADL